MEEIKNEVARLRVSYISNEMRDIIFDEFGSLKRLKVTKWPKGAHRGNSKTQNHNIYIEIAKK